jgi:hypothetical protein
MRVVADLEKFPAVAIGGFSGGAVGFKMNIS